MGEELGLRQGDDSPWAGEVPSSSPVDIRWTTPTRRSTPGPAATPTDSSALEHAIQGYSNADVHPRLRSADEVGADDPDPASSRSKVFVGAAVLGVLALGAVSLIAGRDDTESAVPAGTTASSVPVSAPPPSTDGQLDPAVIESVPTSTDAAFERGPAPGTETETAAAAVPSWTNGVFTVPEALRDLEAPTTVVAVTRDGVLRELDLPSGESREIEVGPVFGFDQFVVGRTSTILSADTSLTSRPSAVWYRAGLPPVDLGRESSTATFLARPSSDEFTGFSFGTGLDDYLDLIVRTDGDISMTPSALADNPQPWLRRYAPNGNKVFSDGGAYFEERPDASVTLVTNGDVLSFSSHHLLVRECDSDHICSDVIIDGSTRERQVAVIGPEFDPQLAGNSQMSPDGTKLWFAAYNNEPTEFIMDLATGNAIEVGASDRSGQGGQITTDTFVWTADSSGIVRSAITSLEYVDAATGVTTRFAEEFAAPVVYGVRLGLNGTAAPSDAVPLDTGIQIAGYSERAAGGVDAVHRIDIDTGEIVSVDVDPIGSSAPVFVMSDAAGISVVAYDNVDGLRVEGDVVSALEGEAFDGLMVEGPRSDTLWVPQETGPLGQPSAYLLVDSLGQTTGDGLQLPKNATGASGSDGTGGVVSISPLGGVFVVDENGAERITTGDLIALGPTVAIADECDDAYACGMVAIDRATGVRTPFEPSLVTATIGAPPQLVASGRAVDPTGQVALVFNRVNEDFMFADLVTEQMTPTPGIDRPSSLVWSDDGRAAVFLSDGVLHLYDRSTATIRPLTQFPTLRVFAELS